MKKFINIFSMTVVLLVIILLALVTTVTHFGITPYAYKNGAVIYVKKTDISELKSGDRVTYKLNESNDIATNTIQSVDTEKGLFYVKDTELSYGTTLSSDELVPFTVDSIIGKTLFTVPLLGYAVEYISSRTGFTVLLAGMTVLILAAFFTASPSSKAEKAKKDENSK